MRVEVGIGHESEALAAWGAMKMLLIEHFSAAEKLGLAPRGPLERMVEKQMASMGLSNSKGKGKAAGKGKGKGKDRDGDINVEED